MKVPMSVLLCVSVLIAVIAAVSCGGGASQAPAGNAAPPPNDGGSQGAPAADQQAGKTAAPVAGSEGPAGSQNAEPAGSRAPASGSSRQMTSGGGATGSAAKTPAPAKSESPAKAESPSRPAEPPTRMVEVSEGRRINVTLDDALSSKTSKPGDTFSVTVSQDRKAEHGAVVAIPVGSVISGEVVEAHKAKEFSGQAKLVLKFTSLRLPSGKTIDIVASLDAEGADTKKRTAAGVGGGALGGAILGRILGKDTKGAVIGAVVGGAIGTGVVASMDNKDVELAAGTPLVLHVDQALQVPVPKSA